MKPESLNRIMNMFSWSVSALAVASLGPFVNYFLGDFYPHFDKLESLLISLALCGLLVLAGMFGYAIAAAFSKHIYLAQRKHAIAGMLYSLCMLGTLILFGNINILPVNSPIFPIMVLLIPVAFGALSCIIAMRLKGSAYNRR